MTAAFASSAPGRLCLFGEHQDYLGLPVIAMAIDRRCTLTFSPRADQIVNVDSVALGRIAQFNLTSGAAIDTTLPMGMALVALTSEGDFGPQLGWDVSIKSDIPIRAGCSSSTALLTAWIAGWLRILHGHFDVDDVVKRCHDYEVLRFNGAGGDMDQFACAHGGLHRFGIGDPVPLQSPQGVFVLADSGQPKNTQGHLQRCRDARIPLMAHLDQPEGFNATDQALIVGTRINRDLESNWASRMKTSEVNGPAMGEALLEHHAVLRDVLALSTPRIESILDAALAAGAWGGKINGSGGGGCAFVLCPEDAAKRVTAAMKQAGAKDAWIVKMDGGVC